MAILRGKRVTNQSDGYSSDKLVELRDEIWVTYCGGVNTIRLGSGSPSSG